MDKSRIIVIIFCILFFAVAVEAYNNFPTGIIAPYFATSDGKVNTSNMTAAPCLYGLGHPASYMICTDGTTVYAVNGTTGAVDYSGTNINTSINSVYSMLPSRKHKATIIIKGSYILSSSISVSNPQYLILDLRQANFTLANSVNDNMFYFTNATNIDIFGGTFDGNRANQGGATGSGIRFNGTNNNQILLSGQRFNNISRYGVYVQYFSGLRIENQQIDNVGTNGSEGRGVYITNGVNAVVRDINGTNFTRYGIMADTVNILNMNSINISNATGDRGIYVAEGYDVRLENCYTKYNNYAGISFMDSQRASITNCNSNNNTQDGLLLQADGLGVSNIESDINVIGGSYNYNSRDGIRLQSLTTGLLSNIFVFGTSANNNGAVGINLNSVSINSLNNTRIHNNVVKHNNDGAAGRGIRLFLARNTTIQFNELEDNNANNILQNGDIDTVIKDNKGVTPHNWGKNSTAPSNPFGVLDTYQNSTSGEAFCSYKASTWQNATGNTDVC